MTTISYLKLYIVISPEKQGYGVTMNAAAIRSSMYRSLEDVIFWIFKLLIDSGTKELRRAYLSIVQIDRRGWWDNGTHSQCTAKYNSLRVKEYLITRLPGMGGALTHCSFEFKTWRAWMPGCCHKIVKHWLGSEKILMGLPKKKWYLPTTRQAKLESKFKLSREY